MPDVSVPRLAVVTGDVTIDWNIAVARHAESRRRATWDARDGTRLFRQRGGAALLADVITQVVESAPSDGVARPWRVLQTGAGLCVNPDDKSFHHSYAIWSAVERTSRVKEARGEAWRISEFLGLDVPTVQTGGPDVAWRRVVDDAPDAELVVLDDAGLGFRSRHEDWPVALTRADAAPVIVLKMSHPIAGGRLWEHLIAHHADRIIVVISADDLRRSPVQITRQLSWERTAEELAAELIFNPHINQLSRCASVVVSFHTAGSYVYSKAAPTRRNEGGGARELANHRLFLDPACSEGTWEREYPGGMVGYTTCLTASIARQLMLEKPNSTPLAGLDLAPAVQAGLSAMRQLHIAGYGHTRPERGVGDDNDTGLDLCFPIERVAEWLTKPAASLIEAPMDSPAAPQSQRGKPESRRRPWSILERSCDNAEPLAERIVLYGTSELAAHPIGKFGNLMTVDRRETESLRSIQILMEEYCAQTRPEPMSIAVFGPPGAGKSFAVKEIAKTIIDRTLIPLTFNLSQLTGPNDLIGPLHQVRDAVLKGAMPLVFWDEFDSSIGTEDLAWLRYFLTPMQDGTFQDGQVTHPIGRAIFVFAGGKSSSLKAFQRSGETKERRDAFRDAKGPDFVSRLRGHVALAGSEPSAIGLDPFFMLRRAVLLRSLLERHAKHLIGPGKTLAIDPGVLRALLKAEHYRHGARSMEAVILMSRLSGRTSFERSSLPSETQLELHTDASDFLDRVAQPVLVGALLERLARAAHVRFVAHMEAAGYTEATHSSMVPFEELPEFEKEQNRDLVRDIPVKLASISCVMLPSFGQDEPFKFSESESLELAEREHERWARLKLNAGWQYAKTTDKAEGLHKALVPWRDYPAAELVRRYGRNAAKLGPPPLPDDEKDKDLTMIVAIPSILAQAGYTIVRVKQRDGQQDAGSSETS
jgi:hypothetical protein